MPFEQKFWVIDDIVKPDDANRWEAGISELFAQATATSDNDSVTVTPEVPPTNPDDFYVDFIAPEDYNAAKDLIINGVNYGPNAVKDIQQNTVPNGAWRAGAPVRLRVYNGSLYMVAGGAGDMLRSVYDINDNGIVDNSERLGGQLPSYYAAANAYLPLRGGTMSGAIVMGPTGDSSADRSSNAIRWTNNIATATAFMGAGASNWLDFHHNGLGYIFRRNNGDYNSTVQLPIAEIFGNTLCRANLTVLGSFNNQSSERYKKDITKIDVEQSKKLLQSEPVSFYYKDHIFDVEEDGTITSKTDTNKKYGLIAEQFIKLFPDSVGMDEEGRPDTIDYTSLIPHLINIVKDQQCQIDDLKRLLEGGA